MNIGDKVEYYPPKKTVDDNRHFPAVIRAIGKRVRITYFSEEFPNGKNIACGWLALAEQDALNL